MSLRSRRNIGVRDLILDKGNLKEVVKLWDGEGSGLQDTVLVVLVVLKTKNEESTRLGDTGLVVELEHLKTKTRLIDKKFVSGRGECEV